nr:MAG TPA: hypothetical protein [Caudoviricetes sp.]
MRDSEKLTKGIITQWTKFGKISLLLAMGHQKQTHGYKWRYA